MQTGLNHVVRLADKSVMSGESEYHIDIISSAEGDFDRQSPQSPGTSRPWVGVHFECCGTYRRIYRRPEDLHYVGHCPKCTRPITLRVGPDGVDARILRATLI